MKKSSDMVNIIYRRGLLQEGDVIEIHSEGCIGAGVSGKVGREMVLGSDPMEGHITVHAMPLYWRKERGHGWLEVTRTSLGNM